jgi:hypothetical protein
LSFPQSPLDQEIVLHGSSSIQIPHIYFTDCPVLWLWESERHSPPVSDTGHSPARSLKNRA